MRLEYQILAAFALDLALGDPRWFPHPVRGIGWLALRTEPLARRMLPWPRAAGVATALLIIGLTGAVTYALVYFAGKAHPAAGEAVSIVLLYTTIAARDLAGHAMAVFRSLAAGDLDEARTRVGMIVGRDAADLTEAQVARAAVESVAESTVDGVTAPLVFAVLAGPVGAMVYKAVSTLDSSFGYRNERYVHFGWASARIDDLANYVPARLTGPVMCLAAGLLGLRAGGALRILLRDARNHASPNSGFAEAAMAGAMGVQLGGLNYYSGQPMHKPTIGDPLTPLDKKHILLANALMYVTTLLFLGACLGARAMVLHLWQTWRVAS